MTNEQLAAKLEQCRAAREIGNARIKLWEDWADGELEAQNRSKGPNGEQSESRIN
jgi:hypothetical protein